MPRGPNGEWRPADTIGRAVLIAKLATGEIEEPPPPHTQRYAPVKANQRTEPANPKQEAS